jgi:pimeloyl-ACP methyl ester carboxylesterase
MDARHIETANGQWVSRAYGSGEPVVLLHGLGSAGTTWNRVVPLLAERFRVFVLDLPGHGLSTRPPTSFDLASLAASLAEALKALRLSAPVVLGHSYAGAIAMGYVFDHPERCRQLVLVSSAGFGVEVHPVLRALTLPVAERVIGAWSRIPMSQVADHPRIGSVLGDREIPFSELLLLHRNLETRLGRAAYLSLLRAGVDFTGQRLGAGDPSLLSGKVPTLIVWGDPDPVIPVAHAEAANAAIQGSRLALIPGGGHAPHRRRPVEFAEAVSRFIVAETP